MQLFKIFDFDHGLLRGFLLIGLLALVVIPKWLLNRYKLTIASHGIINWLMATVVMLTVITHLNIALDSIAVTSESNHIKLDQGQNVYRALLLLQNGQNPYASNAFLDIDYYNELLKKWYYKEKSINFHTDPLPVIESYWQTLDPRALPCIFPVITSAEHAPTIKRDFSTLGAKYGPVTLLGYYPFIKMAGKAGIFWAHLVFFLLLVTIVALLAWRLSNKNIALTCLGLSIILLPSHIRWNTLTLSASDLLPSILSLLFLTFHLQKKPFFASLFLGLAISSKLIPGILFLPFLLSYPKKYWPITPAIISACFLPFLALDANGFINNIIIFNSVRPTDSTALFHYLPAFAKALTMIIVFTTLIWTFWILHKNKYQTELSLLFLILASTGLFLVAKIFHNNYLVWFLPLIALYMVYDRSSEEAEKQIETDSQE